MASGKYALAMCPVCGCRCKYRELVRQVAYGKPTGLWVCPDCDDEDNPQWRVGTRPVIDDPSLDHPYPDNDDEGTPVVPLDFDHT